MLRRSIFKGILGLLATPAFAGNVVSEHTISDRYENDHSIIRWAEKNIKIFNLDSGKRFIKLKPKQKEILMSWMKPDKMKVNVGARQTGKTTLAAIHALYMCMHNADYNYLIMTPSQWTCRHQEEVINNMLPELAVNYSQCIFATEKRSSRMVYTFHNGSRIYVMPADNIGMRGLSCHQVHCVDFDYFKDQQDIYRCLVPCITLNKNSSIILNSTYSREKDTMFKKTAKSQRIVVYNKGMRQPNGIVTQVTNKEIWDWKISSEEYRQRLNLFQKDFNREFLNIL